MGQTALIAGDRSVAEQGAGQDAASDRRVRPLFFREDADAGEQVFIGAAHAAVGAASAAVARYQYKGDPGNDDNCNRQKEIEGVHDGSLAGPGKGGGFGESDRTQSEEYLPGAAVTRITIAPRSEEGKGTLRRRRSKRYDGR